MLNLWGMGIHIMPIADIRKEEDITMINTGVIIMTEENISLLHQVSVFFPRL